MLEMGYWWGYLDSFVLKLHTFDDAVIAKCTTDNWPDLGNDLACKNVEKR